MKRSRLRVRESEIHSDTDCPGVVVKFCGTLKEREWPKRRLSYLDCIKNEEKFRSCCREFYYDWTMDRSVERNHYNVGVLENEICEWFITSLVNWCATYRREICTGELQPPLQISYTRSELEGFVREKWQTRELEAYLENRNGDLEWVFYGRYRYSTDPFRNPALKEPELLKYCSFAHLTQRYFDLKRRGILAQSRKDDDDMLESMDFSRKDDNDMLESMDSENSIDDMPKTHLSASSSSPLSMGTDKEKKDAMECYWCRSRLEYAQKAAKKDAEKALLDDIKLALVCTNLPWKAHSDNFLKDSKRKRNNFHRAIIKHINRDAKK